MEPYLSHIENGDNRKALCQLRLSSHPLNIESLRGKITDPKLRLCTLCDDTKVEDEFHFMMQCNKYENERNIFIENISNYCINFRELNLQNKFLWLLSNEDKQICKDLGHLIKRCFDIRKECLAKAKCDDSREIQ